MDRTTKDFRDLMSKASFNLILLFLCCLLGWISTQESFELDEESLDGFTPWAPSYKESTSLRRSLYSHTHKCTTVNYCGKKSNILSYHGCTSSCWGDTGKDCAPYGSHPGCSGTDCRNRMSADPYADQTIELSSNPADTATFGSFGEYITNTEPSNCFVAHCMIDSGGSTSGYGTHLSMNEGTGVITANRDKVYDLTIKVKCGNYFQDVSLSFKVKSICTTAVTSFFVQTAAPTTATFYIPQDTSPCLHFFEVGITNPECANDQVYTLATALAGDTWPSAYESTLTVDSGVSPKKYSACLGAGSKTTAGSFSFFMKLVAGGGAVYGPATEFKITMECSNPTADAQITEPSFSASQSVEVQLATTVFTFPVFPLTYGTNCYAKSYRIGSAGDASAPPSGIATSALSSTDGSALQVMPSDQDLVQSYTFYIFAQKQDGSFKQHGPYTLSVECLNVVVSAIDAALTYSGTSHNVFVDHANTGTASTFVVKFPLFSSSKTNCPVIEYQASGSTSSRTAVTPVVPTVAFSPGDTDVVISFDTSRTRTFQFSVWGKTDGDYWGHSVLHTINVICGSETISMTAPTLLMPFQRYNSQPLTTSSINFQTSIFTPIFRTDKVDCPVTSYEIYQSSSLSTTYPSTGQILEFQNLPTAPTATSTFDDRSPFHETVIVRGISNGSISADLQLTVVVCGHETLASQTDPFLTYAYHRAAPTGIEIDWPTLKDFFTFTATAQSCDWCEGNKLELCPVADCATVLSGSDGSVELVYYSGSDSYKLKVYDDVKLSLTPYYLRKTTKGDVSITQELHFEICGLEHVQLAPSNANYSLRFQAETGYKMKQTLPIANYSKNFTTTSKNCHVEHYRLMEKDEGSGAFIPYSGYLFHLSDPGRDLLISTFSRGNHTVWIEGASANGTNPNYLRVDVEIYRIISNVSDALVNFAPDFGMSLEDMIYIINESEQEEEGPPQAVTLSRVLPPVIDTNFCKIMVNSLKLGTAIFQNCSSTDPAWVSSKFMTLQFQTRTSEMLEFKLTFQDLQDFKLSKPDQGFEIVGVTLTDSQGASTQFYFKLFKGSEGNTTVSSGGGGNGTDDTDGGDGGDEGGDGGDDGGDGGDSQGQPNISVGGHGSDPEEQRVCTAEILSIDQFGILTINFSTPMKTQGLNISALNASFVDIYVEPADLFIFSPEELSKFNFTWTVTEYEGHQMKLKLVFEGPEWISMSSPQQQDLLIFHIKDPGYFFISKTLLVNLETETMKKSIPPQLGDSAFVRGLSTSSVGAKQTLKATMVVSFIANAFLAGSLSLVLGMVNSLQLIVHLPMLNVAIPANAMLIFKMLIPIVTFDILENYEQMISDLTGQEIGEGDEEEAEATIPAQIVTLGYESHDPFSNLGTLGLFTAFYFTKVIFLFTALKPLSLRSAVALRSYKSLHYQLFFQELIMIFIEGYLEFVIVLSLWSIRSAGYEASLFQVVSVAVIYAVAAAFLPLVLVWFIGKPKDEIDQPEFTARWHSLFDDLKYERTGHRLFYFIFVARRALLVAIAFNFEDHHGLQVILLNLCNLSVMMYQGYFKPIAEQQRNITETINEVFVSLCTFHIMLFTEMVGDLAMRSDIGWSLAATIGVYLLINLFQIIKKLYESLRLIFSKYWALLKKWQVESKEGRKQQKFVADLPLTPSGVVSQIVNQVSQLSMGSEEGELESQANSFSFKMSSKGRDKAFTKGSRGRDSVFKEKKVGSSKRNNGEMKVLLPPAPIGDSHGWYVSIDRKQKQPNIDLFENMETKESPRRQKKRRANVNNQHPSMMISNPSKDTAFIGNDPTLPEIFLPSNPEASQEMKVMNNFEQPAQDESDYVYPQDNPSLWTRSAADFKIPNRAHGNDIDRVVGEKGLNLDRWDDTAFLESADQQSPLKIDHLQFEDVPFHLEATPIHKRSKSPDIRRSAASFDLPGKKERSRSLPKAVRARERRASPKRKRAASPKKKPKEQVEKPFAKQKSKPRAPEKSPELQKPRGGKQDRPKSPSSKPVRQAPKRPAELKPEVEEGKAERAQPKSPSMKVFGKKPLKKAPTPKPQPSGKSPTKHLPNPSRERKPAKKQEEEKEAKAAVDKLVAAELALGHKNKKKKSNKK